jgi:hypothetical protein
MNQAEITYAASQAWIGFWQTCMADAGGSSALDCNDVSIRRALAAEANPLQVVPPSIPALPATDNRPRSELARRLEGDGRISDITIRDVLIGLEDYFAIFRKLRRIHPRGARRFRWRDYDLTISAPGIHHPSPEALVAEPMSDDDVLPIPGDTISIGSLAKKMQRETETVRRIPFRRGQPTVSYRAPQLEEASRRPQ